MKTTNRLVEIDIADWEKLADLYLAKKTEASGWNCIQNYINWFQKDPTTIDTVKFYSLNGDWSDGTFIIQDSITAMFNTLDENQDRLLDALNCIQNLDQLKDADYFCICDFAHRFKFTIDTYMQPTGVEVDVTALWLHIAKEEALNFSQESPPGTHLKALDQSHTSIVNSFWAYRYPGSEIFIDRLIRLNISCGLFDNESNDLLGWCLQLPRGSLGLLQVKEEYKRKGYGSVIVKAISTKIAKTGMEVLAGAVDTNIASRKMFLKLGFKEIDSVHWVCRPMSFSGK